MEFHTLNLLCRYAQSYGRERIRSVGLTNTSFLILCLLSGHGALQQDKIVLMLMMGKTTVAKALGPLEKAGLVQRHTHPSDCRKVIVNITEAGRQKISGIQHIYDEWLENNAKCLTTEEHKIFDDICRRLAKNAELSTEILPFG